MELDTALIKTLRQLGKYLYNLKSVRQRNTLGKVQREIVQSLVANVDLARAQVEFSATDEDAVAQQKGLMLAVEQLEAVKQGILDASMYDLVDVVDVAQLSAMTELCLEKLKGVIR